MGCAHSKPVSVVDTYTSPVSNTTGTVNTSVPPPPPSSSSPSSADGNKSKAWDETLASGALDNNMVRAGGLKGLRLKPAPSTQKKKNDSSDSDSGSNSSSDDSDSSGPFVPKPKQPSKYVALLKKPTDLQGSIPSASTFQVPPSSVAIHSSSPNSKPSPDVSLALQKGDMDDQFTRSNGLKGLRLKPEPSKVHHRDDDDGGNKSDDSDSSDVQSELSFGHGKKKNTNDSSSAPQHHHHHHKNSETKHGNSFDSGDEDDDDDDDDDSDEHDDDDDGEFGDFLEESDEETKQDKVPSISTGSARNSNGNLVNSSNKSSLLATDGTGSGTPVTGNVPTVAVSTAELFETDTFFEVDKEWEHLKTLKLVFTKAGLDSSAQRRFLEALKSVSFRSGEYIVRQGEKGDMFYIISEGEVVVTKTLDDTNREAALAGLLPLDNGELVITHLYEGHFFGETSIVTEQPRNANVRASTPVRCMCMSKVAFTPFLAEDEKFRNLISELVRKKEETTRIRAEMLAGQGGVAASNETARDEVKITRLTKKGKTSNGKAILNGYVLMQKLGAGSYGTVWLAQSIAHSKKYAIKVVSRALLRKKRFGSTAQSDEEVLREVAIMKRLQHKNIVGLLEVIDDPDGDKFYMVQEFCELGPVMTEREYNHPLAPSVALAYMRDILSGLEYLHFQGVVHRDIKPSNILIGSDGTAKLADFGASAICRDSTDLLTEVKGTPAFQPPEVFTLEDGQKYHGFAADIWALGATLHTMVVGVPPYMAANEWELVEKLKHEEFRLATTVQVDPHLRNLLLRCLTKDPAKRITLSGILTHDWVTEEGSRPLINRPYAKLNLAATTVASTTASTMTSPISTYTPQSPPATVVSTPTPSASLAVTTLPSDGAVPSVGHPPPSSGATRPSMLTNVSPRPPSKLGSPSAVDKRLPTPLKARPSPSPSGSTSSLPVGNATGLPSRFASVRVVSDDPRASSDDTASAVRSGSSAVATVNTDQTDDQKAHLRALRLRQHNLLRGHTGLSEREKDVLADQKRIAFHADRAEATVEELYVDSSGTISERPEIGSSQPHLHIANPSLARTFSGRTGHSLLHHKSGNSMSSSNLSDSGANPAHSSNSMHSPDLTEFSGKPSPPLHDNFKTSNSSDGSSGSGILRPSRSSEDTEEQDAKTTERSSSSERIMSRIESGQRLSTGLNRKQDFLMVTANVDAAEGGGSLVRKVIFRAKGADGSLSITGGRAGNKLSKVNEVSASRDGGKAKRNGTKKSKNAPQSILEDDDDDDEDLVNVDSDDSSENEKKKGSTGKKKNEAASRKTNEDDSDSDGDDSDYSDIQSTSSNNSEYAQAMTIDDMTGKDGSGLDKLLSDLANSGSSATKKNTTEGTVGDPEILPIPNDTETLYRNQRSKGYIFTYPENNLPLPEEIAAVQDKIAAAEIEEQRKSLNQTKGLAHSKKKDQAKTVNDKHASSSSKDNDDDSSNSDSDASSDSDDIDGAANLDESDDWGLNSHHHHHRKGHGHKHKSEPAPKSTMLTPEEGNEKFTTLLPAWDSAVYVNRFISCPVGANPAVGIVYGIAEDCGRRATMEDRSVAIASFRNTMKLCANAIEAVAIDDDNVPEYAYFAVYDGHNGTGTSEALAQAFHFRLASHLGLVKSTEESEQASSTIVKPGEVDVTHAFIQAAMEFDDELQQEVLPGEAISGSTGIMVLVRKDKHVPARPTGGSAIGTVTVANVGDSRAVLCARGGTAVDLSVDHKCSRPDERERILAAGGTVIKDRLHGVLAVSRAFGDAEHKRMRGSEMWGKEFTADPLTAEPELVVRPLAADDEFIVLACDGIWDVMTSQQVINFVRRRLLIHRDVRRAAKELVDKALALSSIDNVSAIVVGLSLPPV